MVGDLFWHQPTHRLGNTLDLCMTSSQELVAGVEVIAPLSSSDHNRLEVTVVGMAGKGSTKEEVPDWSKADMKAMRDTLGEVAWGEEFGQLGGVQCMEKLYEVLDRVTRVCVPTKLRRTNSRPLWMNQNIMRMLRWKRRLWRAYTGEGYYRQDYRDYLAYQEVQKEHKKAIRRAKRKLEKDLAKKAKNNPKKFFSYMKTKTANRVRGGRDPVHGE